MKLLVKVSLAASMFSALILSAATRAEAATVVDVELQLLIDTSGSVSTPEFGLQRSGYSSALRSAAIQDAILDVTGDRLGRIAAEVIFWSGSSQQQVAVPWSLLDSSGSIDGFADAIDAAGRTFSGGTVPAAAINFGAPRFASNAFDGAANVMDVSGDGGANASATAAARDAALASGIDRINGLAIGSQSILRFYQNNVIGGSGSFAVLAATFDDVGAAVAQKLAADITGGPPDPAPIPLPATAWLLLGGLGGFATFVRRRTVPAA